MQAGSSIDSYSKGHVETPEAEVLFLPRSLINAYPWHLPRDQELTHAPEDKRIPSAPDFQSSTIGTCHIR
jgi:hypothetical protein